MLIEVTCVPSLLVTLTFNSSTDVHNAKYSEQQKESTKILLQSLHRPRNLNGSGRHSSFLDARIAAKRAQTIIASDPFNSHGIENADPKRGHLNDTFWFPMLDTKYTPEK